MSNGPQKFERKDKWEQYPFDEPDPDPDPLFSPEVYGFLWGVTVGFAMAVIALEAIPW